MNKYLSSLVEKSLFDLECSYCIEIGEVRLVCSLRYMFPEIGNNWIYAPYLKGFSLELILRLN